MKLRRVLIKLGVFTLVTALVTVILASQIGNLALFRARYSIEAAFDDATGIASGDPVTLAGVKVGKVNGARVDHGVAYVKLAIDRNVKLPRATHIEIRYRNFKVLAPDPHNFDGPDNDGIGCE